MSNLNLTGLLCPKPARIRGSKRDQISVISDHKPDPGLYCQRKTFLVNRADLTWNDRDITIPLEGPGRMPSDQIQVRVHNYSPDVPAHETNVYLSVKRFGFGFENIPVAGKSVSLGTAGSSTSNKIVSFRLPRHLLFATANWLSFTALVAHIEDKDRSNNESEHAVAIGYLNVDESGSVEIPIKNSLDAETSFQFEILNPQWQAQLNTNQIRLAAGAVGKVRLSLRTPSNRNQREVGMDLLCVTESGEYYGGVHYRFRLKE